MHMVFMTFRSSLEDEVLKRLEAERASFTFVEKARRGMLLAQFTPSRTRRRVGSKTLEAFPWCHLDFNRECTYPSCGSKTIVQKLFGIIGLRARLSESMSGSSHKQKWRTHHAHERLLLGTCCLNHPHLLIRSGGFLCSVQSGSSAQGH